MNRTPKPRSANYYGMRTTAVRSGNTWLEPEEITYPSGAMLRRAYARCEDGAFRVIRCGLPDTYFSIPGSTRIRGKYVRGYVGSDESGFYFRAYKPERTTSATNATSTPAAA